VRGVSSSYQKGRRRPFRKPLNWLLRRYIAWQKPRNVVATVGGIRYRLDLNELIDANIYYRGVHEPRSTRTAGALLPVAGVGIDVGANSGYYTLLFAQLVGPYGRVIAFEPTALALEKLEENLRLNDFSNVEVVKSALSDTAGVRSVNSDETAFRASWPVTGPAFGSRREVVQFLTLDEYCSRANLPRVDLIKIDVDGYEMRVIGGSTETLARYRPFVLIEIGKYTMQELGDDPLDLAQTLWRLGYGFESDDRSLTFSSPEALIESIEWDEPAMILCRPRPAP
jgi:FkbM family methyltransferase